MTKKEDHMRKRPIVEEPIETLSDSPYEEEEMPKEKVDEKEVQIGELTDRLMRIQAEFDNFRRRTQKEKEELSSYTKALLLGQLLPVLDNFERALDSAEESPFQQGTQMIYRQLVELMEKQGLKKMDVVNQAFDPQYHEAVMSESVEGVKPGVVLQELQGGYQMGDHVIRPAMVKVSA